MAPLNVVVVGGGIGGLAAAAGLARNGHIVTVYERSRQTGGVGFAFRITNNSDRCLRDLGIDTVAGGACIVNEGMVHSLDGTVLRRGKENKDLKDKKEGQGVSVFAYRPQLHQQLYDTALELGAKPEFGIKVQDIDVEQSTVTFDDGRVVHADLIIGADGVHSIVRSKICDSDKYQPMATTKSSAFRFMIPTDVIKKDNLLGPLFSDSLSLCSWVSKGRMIIVYPVDYGRQINVVCSHPENMSDEKVEKKDSGAAIDYDQKVPAATALAIYEDFEPRARRLLELADPDGFRAWKLRDADDMPRWSLRRTVLLGDACHPVLPYGYSGASMAIEDAAILTALLPPHSIGGEEEGEGRDGKNRTWDDLEARLKLYENIRRPRVNVVRDTSRDVGAGKFDKDRQEKYMAFLIEYDAVKDGREKLKEFETSSSET